MNSLFIKRTDRDVPYIIYIYNVNLSEFIYCKGARSLSFTSSHPPDGFSKRARSLCNVHLAYGNKINFMLIRTDLYAHICTIVTFGIPSPLLLRVWIWEFYTTVGTFPQYVA